jgi:hypothetical protein
MPARYKYGVFFLIHAYDAFLFEHVFVIDSQELKLAIGNIELRIFAAVGVTDNLGRCALIR